MDSRSLIDAQFDRAVEIVQGLPKTGPIQTGYEEKLTMYSLYKQATVGNVRSPRPGIWDMLGRAKWDAWAQHKDLDSHEAKWLYVDALLKVLRKYSDKTVAMDLVRELESYGGDASNLVLSRTLSGTSSNSSGSTVPEDHVSRRPGTAQPLLPGQRPSQSSTPQNHQFLAGSSSEDDTEDEEPTELPPAKTPSERSHSRLLRPQSSLSGRHYRTPMTASLAMSPPPQIPTTQPMPVFETPSAFAENPSNFGAVSSGFFRPPSASFNSVTDARLAASYPGSYPAPPLYAQESRSALERALESVQAHVAALTERLEILETRTPPRHLTSASSQPTSPQYQGRDGYFPRGRRRWDMDDWGMWSLVLNPVSRCLDVVNQLTRFFTNNEARSPALTILRRLALDVSFLVCVLAFVKLLWRRSGLRRREVFIALVALWRAIAGSNSERKLIDKGT